MYSTTTVVGGVILTIPEQREQLLIVTQSIQSSTLSPTHVASWRHVAPERLTRHLTRQRVRPSRNKYLRIIHIHPLFTFLGLFLLSSGVAWFTSVPSGH
jgi:hypothetical protein